MSPKETGDQNKSQGIPCGIVMPISSIGGCSERHWEDVLQIITDAVSDVGFSAKLVSTADEITVIQRTIVQNLYNLPIVICDVSEKNPNVMFELGMRLAFDKPTIIIKDDFTGFSFDMGVVEHVEYPRDLRFGKIIDFKARLGEKVKATYSKSQNDRDFSTFLRHFGQFKPADISEQEMSGQEYIMEQLSSLMMKVDRIGRSKKSYQSRSQEASPDELDICCQALPESYIASLKRFVDGEDKIISSRISNVDGHIHLFARCSDESPFERARLEKAFREKARDMFLSDPRFGPELELNR
ncbi:hypothetical protein [Sphingomonas sp.]|uniref:hypothetical protein n=1 Tax=Sphingomonas sp. TaxID=28214 RepID=UPI0031D704F8